MDERFFGTPARMAIAAALAACAFGPAAACPATPDRAAGMRLVPGKQSLADLSLTVSGGQDGKLALAGVAALHGPCADGAEASMMGLVAFADGAVFEAASGRGFAYRPGVALRPDPEAAAAGARDAMPQARFVMASRVHTAGTDAGKRSMLVGLWQAGADYVVAALTIDARGAGAPLELLRSAHPIRSVTYFPAPDTNAGMLGLVESTPDGIMLVGIRWDHVALSRTFYAGR